MRMEIGLWAVTIPSKLLLGTHIQSNHSFLRPTRARILLKRISAFIVKSLNRLIDLRARGSIQMNRFSEAQCAHSKSRLVDTAWPNIVNCPKRGTRSNNFLLAICLDIEETGDRGMWFSRQFYESWLSTIFWKSVRKLTTGWLTEHCR